MVDFKTEMVQPKHVSDHTKKITWPGHFILAAVTDITALKSETVLSTDLLLF